MTEDQKPIDEAIGNDNAPAAEKKRRQRRVRNDKGKPHKTQVKSKAKLAEEAARETAPAPDPLNRAAKAKQTAADIPGAGKKRRIDLSKIKADVSAPLGATKRRYGNIPVRKPGDQKCIRTFPREYWIEDVAIAVREDDKQRKPYLFTAEMAAMVPNQVRYVTLVPYVDKQLNLCLWDLKQNNPDRPNDWNSSALDCAVAALDEWGHVVNSGSEYSWIPGIGNWADPELPDLSQEDMVEKAFPGDHYVEEEEHPFMQELLGA